MWRINRWTDTKVKRSCNRFADIRLQYYNEHNRLVCRVGQATHHPNTDSQMDLLPKPKLWTRAIFEVINQNLNVSGISNDQCWHVETRNMYLIVYAQCKIVPAQLLQHFATFFLKLRTIYTTNVTAIWMCLVRKVIGVVTRDAALWNCCSQSHSCLV